jgi:hypothetical protein
MKWNEKEISEAISLLKKGLSYKEIGIELEREANSIRVKLQKLGYKFSDEQKISVQCLNCDFIFPSTRKGEKKFCSSKCSATHNNKLRGLKNKTHEYKCLSCKNKIKPYGKFCNNMCQSKFRQKEAFEKIKNGDNGLYEKQYKKFLINEYGEKCMDCGWCEVNKYTSKVPIQLEHIDGNSDNNSLDNLKLLCPNCHSLTSTYGALNKGNGRTKRKISRKEYRSKLL